MSERTVDANYDAHTEHFDLMIADMNECKSKLSCVDAAE